MCNCDKSILFVANVTKEHILKFHIPTIKKFINHGWKVDVISSGVEDVPFCHNKFTAKWKRSPFNISMLKGIRQLKKIVNRNKYDIVYCHTPVGGLAARLSCRKARRNGTKVIYCVHGYHFYKGSSILNYLVFYPIEKYLSKLSDAIFVVNQEDYLLTKEKFTKCRICKLVPEVGINIQRLELINPALKRIEYRRKYEIEENTTILMYIAELIPNKNQKMLIDCLRVLIDKGIKSELYLVGPNHSNDALSKYADEMGVSQQVEFLGWRSDIGELLNMADICVASSIREGFGLNIIEAMYCGLPVVATNNRGHSTIIRNNVNGYLVDVNDYKKMAEYVEQIIRNGIEYIKPTKSELRKYDSELVADELFLEIFEVANG